MINLELQIKALARVALADLTLTISCATQVVSASILRAFSINFLAAEGEENILTKGLGWVPGKVKRLQVDERKFRIPHVGWDDVIPKKDGMLFKAVKQPVFYFVHSYHLVPEDSSVIAGVCDYGESFAAAIQKDNIFGVQFHPEKSQKNGLAGLKNFLDFT